MRKATTYVLAGLCLLLLGMVIPSRVQTQEDSTPVRDVENPARTPFHFRCNGAFNPSQDRTSCSFAVPDGQRLVIENIRGQFSVQLGQKVLVQMTGSSVPGGADPGEIIDVPVVLQGNVFGFDRYALNQLTRIYLDHTAENDGQVLIFRDASAGGAFFEVNVSGYLITL